MNGLMPSPHTHPNLFAWASIATKFSDAIASKWDAGELSMPAE